MSDGRKPLAIDAKPGDYVEGILATPAKVVVYELDSDGLALFTTEEMRSHAAKLDPAGFTLSKEKRARVAKPFRDRKVKLGCLIPIEGHGKVRIIPTGDPKVVVYHFEPF